MARAKNNGNGKLEETLAAMQQAMANMALNQTALMQHQTALMVRLGQLDAEMVATNRINSERFARIEALLAEHSQILGEHSRILAEMPEKIEELFAEQSDQTLKKLGFHPPAKE
jgi:chromosome segregation ATPase